MQKQENKFTIDQLKQLQFGDKFQEYQSHIDLLYLEPSYVYFLQSCYGAENMQEKVINHWKKKIELYVIYYFTYIILN